jgi:nucleoside-diphosphate-sugar epimerase
MSKKTIVTGASGHIGGNLVRSLLAQHREVCCLVRRDTRAIDDLNEETEYADKPHNYAYDRSKARGQQAVLEVVEKGLNAVVVNPTGVIGAYDYKPSRMGLVFLNLYNGRLPAIVAGSFNFVDVQDVVECAKRWRTSTPG